MIYLRLFYEFFKTGLFAIGGGLATLPFLSDMANRTGWFTQAQLADMLAVQDDVYVVRTKDYIKNPKKNGYRSLHLVVRIPVFLSSHTELVPVEVQIRTIAMDFWASLEHQLRYKSDQQATQDLRRRLQTCAETSAALDAEMQNIYREINAGQDFSKNTCADDDFQA